MGFDWGGFTGSFVGIIGAWGVAKYSINHQNKKEKPTINSKRYDTIIKINKIMISSTFLGFDDEEPSVAMLCKQLMLEVRGRLDDLLPDALEVDLAIHDLIEEISRKVNELSKKYLVFASDEETNSDINNYEGFLRDLHEIRKYAATECGKFIALIKISQVTTLK